MTILRFFAPAAILIFSACSNTESPAITTDNTPVLAPDKAAMPADQIATTRNASPELVAEEKMETPVPINTPTETRQVASPDKASNPKITEASPQPKVPKPTAAPSPASPPSPAPATAPVKETPVTPAPEVETEAPEAIGAPSHAAWQSLLKTYVDGRGRVNYAGLKQQESELDAYLATLAEAIPKAEWTRNERLAYWLNAYNANTVKLILNNHPVKKITDLSGGDPWKVKWIELEGKMYSLNQIEHDIIRPRFKDPRIHFAVVCAAVSCPPLANEAFTSRNVNGLLDTRTRQFINNENFNVAGDSPRISKIFEWYAEDFGDVKAYLNKYLKTPIPADAALGYADYDWSLNKQ